MMILKLTPNEVTTLPVTAYYGITLVNLQVGESGINSCILKIRNNGIEFKTGGNPDKKILTVNGEPDNTPTFILAPNEEYTVRLELPHEFSELQAEEGIFLHYYLSYSVPKG